MRLHPRVRRQIATQVAAAAKRTGKEAETGGPLWGGCDEVRRTIWVDAAGPAPSDSVETVDRFICGVEGLDEEAKRRQEETRGATTFIGTWHTHLSDPPDPSTRDQRSMADVCTRDEPLPPRFLMMIIGSPHDSLDLKAHVFLRDEYSLSSVTG